MSIRIGKSLLYPSVTIVKVEDTHVEFVDHLGRTHKRVATKNGLHMLLSTLEKSNTTIEIIVTDGMIVEVNHIPNMYGSVA